MQTSLNMDSEFRANDWKEFGYCEELVEYLTAYAHPRMESWQVSIPLGWQDLLLDLFRCLDKIEGLDLKVLQIKSKFGGLRFYYGTNADPRIEQCVDEAEIESFKVCENCGQPGESRNKKWWISTKCIKCWEAENSE